MNGIMKLIRLFLFMLCIVTFCSCGKSSELESESENEVSKGFAPADIIGKTLVLKKSAGTTYLSTEHLDESSVIVNNQTIDYTKYPPSYSYETIKNNEALYYLQVTKKTYVPLYQTNHYSNFSFTINLMFTSKTNGTFKGIETNAEGKDKDISGTFTLN